MDTVTIPASHLAALEAEIADLKSRLAKRMHNNIDRLRAYREAHPEKASAQSKEAAKRYKEANREAYNARRRELRRLKKAGAGDGGETAATAPS